MMDAPTCPHFQTRMEEVPRHAGSTVLPIRRCLLSERMVALLRPVPAAQTVVWTVALDPTEEPPVCLNGPDFDTIEHARCTVERCEVSCSLRYRALLARFGVADPAPVDCAVSAGEPPAPQGVTDARES